MDTSNIVALCTEEHARRIVCTWHLHVHTFSAFISSLHLTCQPLTPPGLLSPRWDHTAVQQRVSALIFLDTHLHTHTSTPTHMHTAHSPPHPRELPFSWPPHISLFCSQPCASYSSLYSPNSCFPQWVFPDFQDRVHVLSCDPLA